MADPAQSTLAGDYVTIPVTITATAQSVYELTEPTLTTLGYAKSKIMQTLILGTQSESATERSAILFGGSDGQYGYLAAGDERVFPVRGDRVYLKRAGGSDVSAVLEVYLRQQ
jgi:hypothetical protein